MRPAHMYGHHGIPVGQAAGTVSGTVSWKGQEAGLGVPLRSQCTFPLKHVFGRFICGGRWGYAWGRCHNPSGLSELIFSTVTSVCLHFLTCRNGVAEHNSQGVCKSCNWCIMVWWVLLHLYSCATLPQASFRTITSPPKFPSCPFRLNPCSHSYWESTHLLSVCITFLL